MCVPDIKNLGLSGKKHRVSHFGEERPNVVPRDPCLAGISIEQIKGLATFSWGHGTLKVKDNAALRSSPM